MSNINIPHVPEDACLCRACVSREEAVFWSDDKTIEEPLSNENPAFITKDSGQRQEFSTGMRRDVQTDKPRYDLLDRAMLKRWAELMARGAAKYGEENWRLASTDEEYKRFQASAVRHMFQWLDGETDEDHASAVFFNIAGAEMVAQKIRVAYGFPS